MTINDIVDEDNGIKLDVSGLFIAVGQIPENQNFAKIIKLDDKGYINNLVLEEKRIRKFNREEHTISWNNIVKIGDDIILIDTRNK